MLLLLVLLALLLSLFKWQSKKRSNDTLVVVLVVDGSGRLLLLLLLLAAVGSEREVERLLPPRLMKWQMTLNKESLSFLFSLQHYPLDLFHIQHIYCTLTQSSSRRHIEAYSQIS